MNEQPSQPDMTHTHTAVSSSLRVLTLQAHLDFKDPKTNPNPSGRGKPCLERVVLGAGRDGHPHVVQQLAAQAVAAAAAQRRVRRRQLHVRGALPLPRHTRATPSVVPQPVCWRS